VKNLKKCKYTLYMKLTNQSEKNIRFILDNYSSLININKCNSLYMKKFFNDIKRAEEYVSNIEKNIRVEDVKHISDINKPTNYNSTFFPEYIKEYIELKCLYLFTVELNILSRKFSIYFYLCEKKSNLDYFKKYVDMIATWLYIASEHSSNMCANTLNIYIYLSHFKKTIPTSSLDIMGVDNVNTAFTTSCNPNGEIVIFRQEEWFKVFIHETFHVFGLDFSNINSNEQKKIMKDIFPINSTFNIEESYCEFWARVYNILLFSYDNFNKYEDFKMCFEINIELEKIHSMIQVNKVLQFMGLNYKHLCMPSLQHICRKLYKENSNVFAYYVLTSILLNNLNDTFKWCGENNISMLRFKKNPQTLTKYVEYIKSKYKKKKYVEYTSKIKKFNTNSTVMSLIEYI
tara:strand:- start:15601 stop:16806 length:1206 start_codon:yes stop_codon:yes gene_type:complete